MNEKPNYILNTNELEKIYSSLKLPKKANIDKNDYLEYYSTFGNNIKQYFLFKDLKDPSMSWKDFRLQVLPNITWGDINIKERTIALRYNQKKSQDTRVVPLSKEICKKCLDR